MGKKKPKTISYTVQYRISAPQLAAAGTEILWSSTPMEETDIKSAIATYLYHDTGDEVSADTVQTKAIAPFD